MRNQLTFVLLMLGALAQGCTSPQRTFTSPDDAVTTLISAVRDGNKTALTEILGAPSKNLLDSGDPVDDETGRDAFIAAYDEKHAIVDGEDGAKTLLVGNTDWPLPIPLVQDDKSKWVFDTEAGKDEIINRRVGRNELTTIQVCMAIADAQRDYAMNDADGDNCPNYATRFVSEPGTKNGLYFQTEEGQPDSPLGELVAKASMEGYKHTGKPQPYHGYQYRLLTQQGEHANGGAVDYIINGKLMGGFAVIAWPAEYGNSGVMTFIINADGVVFQRDLGEKTDEIAKKIDTYDPDTHWAAVVN